MSLLSSAEVQYVQSRLVDEMGTAFTTADVLAMADVLEPLVRAKVYAEEADTLTYAALLTPRSGRRAATDLLARRYYRDAKLMLSELGLDGG